jgi:hypothetical protein
LKGKDEIEGLSKIRLNPNGNNYNLPEQFVKKSQVKNLISNILRVDYCLKNCEQLFDTVG